MRTEIVYAEGDAIRFCFKDHTGWVIHHPISAAVVHRDGFCQSYVIDGLRHRTDGYTDCSMYFRSWSLQGSRLFFKENLKYLTLR